MRLLSLSLISSVALVACQSLPADKRVAALPATSVELANEPTALQRNELILSIQVCRPDKVVAFETLEVDLKDYGRSNDPEFPSAKLSGRLSFRHFVESQSPNGIKDYVLLGSTIDTYSEGSLKSAGSGSFYLSGNTETGQPVYEKTGRAFREHVALGINQSTGPGTTDFATYWFKPPAAWAVPIGSYTNWQHPISVETHEQSVHSRSPVSWDAAHGRGTPLSSTDQVLPRMRFMLTTWEQIHKDAIRPWRSIRDWLPWMLEQQGKPLPRNQRYFLETQTVSIPPC
jgi:hypothetical protein